MATPHAPAIPHATTSDYTIIPPPGRPWTEADLLALDNDDHHQYELVQGELRQMSPASFRHGGYEIRIIAALIMYLAQHPGLGELRPGDTGFTLQSDPPTIPRPFSRLLPTWWWKSSRPRRRRRASRRR